MSLVPLDAGIALAIGCAILIHSSPTQGASGFQPGYGLPGISGEVIAAIEYEGNLFAGGVISTAGHTDVSGIARWNGSQWMADDGGIRLMNVQGFVVHEGSLYAFGGFTPGLARWLGNAWEAIAPPRPADFRSAVSLDGALWMLGADPETWQSVVWRWDETWTHVQPPESSLIPSLEAHNGAIYVGGLGSNRDIARLDGDTWTRVSGPSNVRVSTLRSFGGELYAGNYNSLYRWDGVAWQSFAEGRIQNGVVALSRVGAELWISDGGGNIIRTDGDALVDMGRVAGGVVHDVSSFQGDAVIVGRFGGVDGHPLKSIAVHREGKWAEFDGWPGNGIYGLVDRATRFRGNVVVGGSIAAASGAPAHGVVEWVGERWREFGTSNPYLSDLVEYRGDLIAATTEHEVDDQVVVKRWNGDRWEALSEGGPMSEVDLSPSLLVHGEDLYVATPLGVWRFDGTQWQSAGFTVPLDLGGLAWHQGELYVGGYSNDPHNRGRVVRWTESGLQELPPPPLGVSALASFQGDLVAAGRSGTAWWSGTEWTTQVAGIEGTPRSLALDGDRLYMGSMWERRDSPRSAALHEWTGTEWEVIGRVGGTHNPAIEQILPHEDGLLVVGSFDWAGNHDASGVAFWKDPLFDSSGASIATLGLPYPSPSRDRVAVDFSLTRPGRVTIEVFDSSGRRIAGLFDGFAWTGTGVVNWDSRDEKGRYAPAGTYWIRMSALGQTETHRAVIIR